VTAQPTEANPLSPEALRRKYAHILDRATTPTDEAILAKSVHTEYLTDELARAQTLLAQVDAATDWSAAAVARRYGDVVAELRLLVTAIKTDADVRAMRDAR
jgi:hypothetical protein